MPLCNGRKISKAQHPGGLWRASPISGKSASRPLDQGGAHTGIRVAGTILNNNYPANFVATLVSPRFVVPAAGQQPRLRFWSWHDTASAGDYGQVWIKTEGGVVTNLTEQLADGTGGAWMQRLVDLRAYGGQTVQLGFQFVSDQSNSPAAPGWYIDDVSVETGPLMIDLVNNPEGFENGWGNWSVVGSVIGDQLGANLQRYYRILETDQARLEKVRIGRWKNAHSPISTVAAVLAS